MAFSLTLAGFEADYDASTLFLRIPAVGQLWAAAPWSSMGPDLAFDREVRVVACRAAREARRILGAPRGEGIAGGE